jgi:PiT family inorganic phosphate transporter/sulfate permease
MNAAAIIALSVCKVGWKETFVRNSIKKLAIVWVVAPLIALFLSLMMVVIADKLEMF